MTIQQAIEKAIEGGYHPEYIPKFLGKVKVEKVEIQSCIKSPDYLIDPLFWQSLYGSEKYGRIKALELINAIFDGKSAEKFFEQESGLGEEQQEKTLS